jgi:hypothetical protein
MNAWDVWKKSTLIFLLQIILGGVGFLLTQHIASAVVGGLMIAPFFAEFMYTGWKDFIKNPNLGLVPSLAAAAGIIFFLGYRFPQGGSSGTTLQLVTFQCTFCFVGIIVFSSLVAGSAKDAGAKEPFRVLLLAAMPLGIGTILGGLVLLCLPSGKLPGMLTSGEQKPSLRVIRGERLK